ncbi:MAG: hypothetical protein JNM56_28025 [Planctomycetia bacterium]|nr:hypothetical protein [Planctomycetia bacterium]
MPRFYIVSESSEDTLAAADNLQDAVGAARQAAVQGAAGELVSVLESSGRAVKQFVLLPDGTVAEQPIATSTKSFAAVAAPDLAGPPIAVGDNRPTG